MVLAPKLNRSSIRNKGRYCYKRCPYSLGDISNRVPSGERTHHLVTSGYMDLEIRDGHDNAGWVCKDPTCPFYLGTAVTPITLKVNDIKLNRATGEYWMEHIDVVIPICSGTWFWEK